MKVVREIREVSDNEVTIKIPDGFKNRRIEIIVIPVGEFSVKKGFPADFFDRFAGSIPDFPELDSEGDFEVRELLA